MLDIQDPCGYSCFMFLLFDFCALKGYNDLMLKYQISQKLISKRLLSVVGVILVSGLLVPHMAEAFQIRQADSLRVMKSKPFSQSANFKVSADMFIQPSRIIRSSDLVIQAPAVVAPSSTPVTPIVQNNSGGGSGGNGSSEKYDASNWILSRKYEELVRAQEEREALFLTSAPENIKSSLDYHPTNPSDVDLVKVDLKVENNREEAPDVTTNSVLKAPANVLTPSENRVVPNLYVEPTTNNPITAEQLLITAPISLDNLIKIEANKSQKEFLKKEEDAFKWARPNNLKEREEIWLSSSPSESVMEKPCTGCKSVLWLNECRFVLVILLLILVLLIINILLQLALFKIKNR